MKTPGAKYLALLTLVSAASCSQEAAEPDVIDWTDESIYFKTSLSDVAASRAQNMTLDNLMSFQVTCFAEGTGKDEYGHVEPYFEDKPFIRSASQVPTFISPAGGVTYYWPSSDGIINFFAFSPSTDDMADGNPVVEANGRENYFNLLNESTEQASGIVPGYRLANFRIHPDISRQSDFVTAHAAGEHKRDFMGGVDLAFRHHLSQIELRAWGSGEKYDIEIAGVRLGNPVVEGDFSFCDPADPSRPAGWDKAGSPVTAPVEYIFCGDGDNIYSISRSEHSSAASARSIMGAGGCAMVLPTVNPKWEALDDPDIENPDYTTGKMYFSVLMRLSYANGGEIYPYPGNPYGQKVEYFAVSTSGKITARLYPGESGDYYTDKAHTFLYTLAAGEEVRAYGWAAIPVDADWAAGKKYIYTIDYSDAVGCHDPEDPRPGTPIGPMGKISISVDISDWTAGSNSDVTVPRK